MSTGALPFVRGIDFSNNDFSGNRFPDEVSQMAQATWLKLNGANLERVPDVLSNLKNLEHLQMSRNKLQNVHGELSDLPCLRSVIVRHNQIKTSGIPTDIFRMKDLTIIDFSNNSLRDIPSNMEYAKCAIVLNLSRNNIENVPNQIFSNLIDLIYLDLSNNKIEVIPPQLKRLVNLQVLKLSNNPLTHFQLKQLPGSKYLRVLHLRNTHRNLDNIPLYFDEYINLQDLDLSMNEFTSVPESIYALTNLRKLDLSHNKLEKMEIPEGAFEKLETLILSGNNLVALPEGIIRCSRLQRLYASYNKLTFEGLPGGIGKLVQLQSIFFSYNNLKLIPQGIARCVKLQRLKLDNNNLITLPDGIYLLPDLRELDLHNNEELVMPPKPLDKQKALAFYNIDFSLSNQLRLAGHSPASSLSSLPNFNNNQQQKDPVQRKKDFIKRRRHQADQDGASKLIQGMSMMARAAQNSVNDEEIERASRPAISWKEKMEQQKPRLDYSDVFDEDVGLREGLWVWEIENFYPQIVDPSYYGQFYEADCYLVLRTTKMPCGSLTHAIFYWIGEKTTLDKGMCAAVHAVNLRNHLGASCRTVREEMNDESDEFLELFNEEIVYYDGARTQSGFYTIEKPVFIKKLYRACVNGQSVEMEAVPLSVESLDPCFVFLLDCGEIIWIWSGYKSRVTVANKVRLFAVKMNKRDRKARAEIESCGQLKTPEEFWLALTGSPKRPDELIVEHVPLDYTPERKRLYQVQMGMGYLDLPQVELNGTLKKEVLQTKNVYILDCTSDIYLWVGKNANRLVKMAGQKMVVELHRMLERPDYTTISRETEGEESTFFRSRFLGWDDIVPFDFTRTADSVQRRGADLKVIMERDKLKTDLVALFLDRLPPMSHEDSDQMIEECNEDLEVIEPFVLENKKFVRLPKEEFGTFYTMDCYVFLCRYFVINEESDDDDEDEGEMTNENEQDDKAAQKSDKDEKREDFKCVVYFWQGRDANNMGWLQFTFSLQKKFESLFKDKLEVIRMYQQQENQKFMSHFRKKFVIRRGRRNLALSLGGKWPELFHMRANGSAVCNRIIQIDCQAKNLNSAFYYILRCPMKAGDDEECLGKAFVWKGSKVDVYFADVANEVANELAKLEDVIYTVELLKEGEETDQFWMALGGKKKYDRDADFINHTRLFRCTNEKGYFSVSEKTVDFCQDDLEDEDVMIVDTGQYVFLWLGSKASEVEVKLAYKAAQVYVGHMQMKQPERPRKLMLSLKGRESKRFTRVFHGWGKHKVPAGD